MLNIHFSLSHRYNYYMAIFSVTFLLLSYQLTTLLGPVGFILANCTNMIFRISYSTFYIYKQFQPIKLNPLNGIRPGKLFLIVLLIMGIACKVSQVKMCFVFNAFQSFLNKNMLQKRILGKSIVLHLLIGVVCTVFTLLAWGYENKQLILIGLDKYKKKKEKNS